MILSIDTKHFCSSLISIHLILSFSKFTSFLWNFIQLLVDTLVKRAYDNWHQAVEYDSKVLNSLASTSKAISSSATPIADHNYTAGRNISTVHVQNRQQYISEPDTQCQYVPQLIEFPCVRSNQTAVMTFNNSQVSLSDSIDCMPVGTTAVGNSYFSGDWSHPRNGEGSEDIFAEEIRLRSSEMLESDDMQRLLKTYSTGVGVGMGVGFGHSDEPCFSYSVEYESQMDRTFGNERGRSSGKAFIGWLKLKAALRWGIFVRKKAAERRAQLTELD